MNARKMSAVGASLMSLGFTLGLNSGCAGCLQPTPPPEAVLSGTWLLVPTPQTNPTINNMDITFDSNGVVTQLSYSLGESTSVTWSNPPNATNVDGSSVYVSITNGGSNVTFSGTLNSENTEATGNVTTNLIIGGITVSLDNGPATMTKQ